MNSEQLIFFLHLSFATMMARWINCCLPIFFSCFLHVFFFLSFSTLSTPVQRKKNLQFLCFFFQWIFILPSSALKSVNHDNVYIRILIKMTSTNLPRKKKRFQIRKRNTTRCTIAKRMQNDLTTLAAEKFSIKFNFEMRFLPVKRLFSTAATHKKFMWKSANAAIKIE